MTSPAIQLELKFNPFIFWGVFLLAAPFLLFILIQPWQWWQRLMCAVFMLLCVLWQFKRHVYRKSLWLGWQAGKFYRYYDQQWHAVEPINVLVLPWLIRFSLANEFERRDVLILTFAISPEAHRQWRILLRFNTDPSNK